MVGWEEEDEPANIARSESDAGCSVEVEAAEEISVLASTCSVFSVVSDGVVLVVGVLCVKKDEKSCDDDDDDVCLFV